MKNNRIIWIIVIIIVIMILCVCCAVGGYLVYSNQDSILGDLFGGTETNQPYSSNTTTDQNVTGTPQPQNISDPTFTPEPTVEVIDPNQQTWLVMLYQNADDNSLEYDIFFDANEAEYIGSTDRVQVVTQLDRYWGSFEGDGDWSGAKRFVLTADGNLEAITSQEVADLGEVNMGDVSTLVDFADWAIQTYPADRYVLIMSDHGAGWLGGWMDSDNNDHDGLLMREIAAAMEQIVVNTGIGKLDILGFDACLMGQLEALTEVAPFTDIVVASEEVEPAIGWAYAYFLRQLTQNPAMSPAELSGSIVNGYIAGDHRLADPDQLDQMMYDYYADDWSEQEFVAYMGADVTLSAVSMDALPLVTNALNELSHQLTLVNQSDIARARTYAQSYYNIFGSDVPPSYIDLAHFAKVLKEEISDPGLQTVADNLISAIDQAVLYEMHGPERPGSHGISIYFPNSDLYVSSVGGYQAYVDYVSRFATVSQWDDFLAYHYSGQEYVENSQGPATPPDSFNLDNLQEPGLGDINIEPIYIDPETIGVEESVYIETTVSGTNIGNIYFFAGQYFPEEDVVLGIYADFIISDSVTIVDGVAYPDWGDGPVYIGFDWYPEYHYITDGEDYYFAMLLPLYYGATYEEMSYAVNGIFTYGDSGEQTYAYMTFGGDGWMREVYSYDPDFDEGPRQINPQDGDSFTIILNAIIMPDDPDASTEPEFEEYEGGTLYFGGSNFYWDWDYVDPGLYLVGIGAMDYDYNYNLDFAPLEIVD